MQTLAKLMVCLVTLALTSPGYCDDNFRQPQQSPQEFQRSNEDAKLRFERFQSSKTLFRAQKSQRARLHLPKSTLSLVVAGDDKEHVAKHLKKIAWLAKHRNVKIGNVLVVGVKDIHDRIRTTKTSRSAKLQRVSMKSESNPLVATTLAEYYRHLEHAGMLHHEMFLTKRFFIKAS